MAGNGTKKVDRFTAQLFDPEVNTPEHDQVLTTLFSDEATLKRILNELHGCKQLPELRDELTIQVTDRHGNRTGQTVSFSEACQKTDKTPRWTDPMPVRITRKQLEVLMNYSTDEYGKYERLIGFVDIGVLYHLVTVPSMSWSKEGGYEWEFRNEHRAVMLEVKAEWPTAGNLLRQLNLYRNSRPTGFSHVRRTDLVVGPDRSMEDLIMEHGYRLVTFDTTGTQFTLIPLPREGPKAKDAPVVV